MFTCVKNYFEGLSGKGIAAWVGGTIGTGVIAVLGYKKLSGKNAEPVLLTASDE